MDGNQRSDKKIVLRRHNNAWASLCPGTKVALEEGVALPTRYQIGTGYSSLVLGTLVVMNIVTRVTCPGQSGYAWWGDHLSEKLLIHTLVL